ncbi:MAG: hypothetical protein AB1404_12365 [Spirochaetota bacterium]|jgi:hypothetical protein
MGLLQRAAVASTTTKPDPMAEALVERILRLAPTSNRVYTVLSLLKTYIPFQGAIVFAQNDEVCTSIEIIGIDIPGFTIQASEILPFLPNKDDTWFSAEFIKSWDFLKQRELHSAQAYLVNRSVSHAIFIVFFEDLQEKIHFEDLSFILSRIHSIFTSDTPLVSEKDIHWDPKTWMNSVFSELLKPGTTLSIGIFESPAHLEDLEKALGNRGRIHALGDSKCIVIIETNVDPELFFHRIQKSFAIKLLDSFETADSLAAVQRIS